MKQFLNEYKIFKIEPANNSLSPSSVKKIIIATAGVIVLTLGVLFSIYFYKKSQKNKSQCKTTEVSPLITHVKIIDLEHLNVNQ